MPNFVWHFFMAQQHKTRKNNRDITWLSFNNRVLQEANDPSVPLVERLRFLGIFSSNRDEFFKVRVASLHRLVHDEELNTDFDMDPEEVLKRIQKLTIGQQEDYTKTYQTLMEAMKMENILILNETQLLPYQMDFVRDFFSNQLRPFLVPLMLSNKREFPTLNDKAPYLAVMLEDKTKKSKYALIEIPTSINRLVILPSEEKGKTYLMYIDDIIRLYLREIFVIFEFNSLTAYSFKITRDAELDIEDDISTGIIEKISKGLERRKLGDPIRIVYDSDIPRILLNHLLRRIGIDKAEHIIPSGRYHNMRDFTRFPDLGRKELVYPKLVPQTHPDLEGKRSILQVLTQKDVLLSYPYQRFDHLIDLLREAAIDPKVNFIYINLYRVASNSKVVNALENAVRNGKKVVVVVELRARFDEENNIFWANHLQEAGVKVIFGVPGLKVHSKLVLIGKKEQGKDTLFAHVGTGNFNENTAKVYTDYSLLTSDVRITKEVEKVFKFLQNNYERAIFKNLWVSPFNSRRKIIDLIDKEIAAAKEGKEAWMIVKVNNLVDDGIIRKLYQASTAGVKIQCIIRGTCGLVPGVKGMSDNISVISIIDRFLEHSRVFITANQGSPLFFLGSADWMLRNLDFRVEVTTPIFQESLKEEIWQMIQWQLNDNQKARIIHRNYENDYQTNELPPLRSQEKIYEWFQSFGS